LDKQPSIGCTGPLHAIVVAVIRSLATDIAFRFNDSSLRPFCNLEDPFYDIFVARSVMAG
jgi:hypothetical protein